MLKSEMIDIKLMCDNAVRYLDSRGDDLTVAECRQEIGHLRLSIFNTYLHSKERSPKHDRIF